MSCSDLTEQRMDARSWAWVVFTVAGLLLITFPAAAQSARAIDGDTIEVAGQRVRLFGIDAPERSQTCAGDRGRVYECGRDAAATLAELVRGREVTCHQRDRDRYGRIVATCATEAGDLGAAMVRQGWAIDYDRYSNGRYAKEQAQAKAEKLGIWSGRFDLPEDWRRQHARGR